MSIADNLLMDFNLNEVSGNSLSAVNSLTLTDVGGVTSSTGNILALARTFNGSTQSLEMADNSFASMALNASRTTSFWVKFTATGTMGLVTKDDLGTNVRERNIYITAGKFVAEIYGATGGVGFQAVTANTYFVQSGGVTTGVWYNIIVVIDYANALLKIYVNGVLDTTVMTTVVWDGTAKLRLGAWTTNGAGSNFLNGSMALFREWDRVLTDVEIAAVLAGLGAFGTLTQNSRNLSQMGGCSDD